MKQVQFNRLTTRLEGFARRQPKLYKLNVLLLAMLGYGYIVGLIALFCLMLAVLVAGIGWIVVQLHAATLTGPVVWLAVPAATVLATAIVQMVRTLRIQIPVPEGRPVEHHQAPRLFAMIDNVSAKLKAPKPHAVLVDARFNGRVAQVPRYGLLGFQRVYLVIGLPIMQALSPEEFRALVAHEMGHISRNHGRFGGWIYRLRETWMRLLSTFQEHWMLAPFFRWYAPYFSAYSFVLARANEYVADQCAARVCGAEAVARCLVGIEVKDLMLVRSFWPKVYQRADDEPYPSSAPFNDMFETLGQGGPLQESEDYLQEVLTEKPEYDDVHPALYQRLAALGWRITPGGPLDPIKSPVPVPQPLKQSAAMFYLGAFARRFADELDREWRETVHREWIDQHKQAQWDRSALAALAQRGQREQLSYEEYWKLANLTSRFAGEEYAVPVLRQLLKLAPGHFQATLTLGHILAESGSPEGLGLLERAKALDARHASAIDQIMVRFTRRCSVPAKLPERSAAPSS